MSRRRYIRSYTTSNGHPRKSRKQPLTCAFAGAPEGIRTPNLLIRSQMLYPLSYGRVL